MGHKLADYDRVYDPEVYDKEYYEGEGLKSGYKSYMQAKGIVSDQFHMIANVMYKRCVMDHPVDYEPPLQHLDVGCAYGFSCEAMQLHGWKSSGFDVSPYAIGRANELNPNRLTKPLLFVGEAIKSDPYIRFKDKEIDLVTAVEFFEHIETKDVDRVLKQMARVGRWGLFVINGSTEPDPEVNKHDGDHGHLNHHPIATWIGWIQKYGQIDLEAMFEFSNMAFAYNQEVHWHNRCIVVKFN